MASLGSLKAAIFDREEKKLQYQSHIRGLDAYDRHKKFMKDYDFLASNRTFLSALSATKSEAVIASYTNLDAHQWLKNLVNSSAKDLKRIHFYGNTKNVHDVLPVKTDQDTLREGYRFILSEEDDMDSTWEKRLVKRYYDKLFKEYCIADMSQYKKGKIGLRWRTEKEVISGKGQFLCGNKQCNEKDNLGSYEVNFSYFEAGENKQALVKLVACERCAEKLVYKKQKEKEQIEKREKDKHKRKRERVGHDISTDDEYDSTDRRRKGLKTSSSTSGTRKEEDENFEEFLEGMFP